MKNLILLCLMFFTTSCTYKEVYNTYEQDINPALGNFTIDAEHSSHIQGAVNNEKENLIYTSFSTKVVVYDYYGIKQKESQNFEGYHIGSPTIYKNKIVSVHSDTFDVLNNTSKVIFFNDDLSINREIPLPEISYGAGAILFFKDNFFIAGGIDSNLNYNVIYQYDIYFNLISTHIINSGTTRQGIQTLFTDGVYMYAGVKDGWSLRMTFENNKLEYDKNVGIRGHHGAFFYEGSTYYLVNYLLNNLHGADLIKLN